MSSSKLSKDTLDMQSVYFFRANTNKVDSSKIIEMYLRTFIIKVLVFIILPPFLKEKRMTLTLNVPINIITNIYSYINKNVTNCLNLIADNKLARNYVLKDPKVQEYMMLSGEGYTDIVRGIHTQDVNFAKLNGFDCMDNNGNIFTANMLNTKGYDLDHILPYDYLLA